MTEEMKNSADLSVDNVQLHEMQKGLNCLQGSDKRIVKECITGEPFQTSVLVRERKKYSGFFLFCFVFHLFFKSRIR